jgi:endo-1,4-beta-xylanase
MYKKLCAISLVGVCCLILAAQQKDSDSLRSYADKLDFWIGTVIQGKFFPEPQYQATLGREFNSAVSIVFPRLTQPERGHFNFGGMDRDIKFARAHKMKLFGVTLVYRNDNSPDWLHFEGGRCAGWSADELDKILKEHIETVVRHGGDDFYGWEVVNETLAPGSNGCWSRIMGQERLIVKAFSYAREASPNGLLLLNDTFGRQGVDRGHVDDFFKLVRKCKSQGAPIDAVGVQMHLEAHELRAQYLDEFKYFLDSARKAEVQVFVTEMDVYQGPPGAFPDAFGHQKEIFYNVTHACLKDTNCKGLTVWGVSDKNAWQPKFRNINDTKPLLFDENYERKPAYNGVLQALKEGR